MDREATIEQILNLLQEVRICFIKRHMKVKGKLPTIFPAQAAILQTIEKNPNRNQNEIAQELNISRSAVNQSVNSLLNHNLIIKERAEENKKSSKISLSDKAKELISKFKAANRNEMSTAFAGLTDEELRTFFELGSKIKDGIINN